jgi:hypothetical protein
VPSWEISEQQTGAYRESVLPPNTAARISFERASSFGWAGYVGEDGRMIGMRTFGASAPLEQMQRKFGFELGRIAGAAKDLLCTQRQRQSRTKSNVSKPRAGMRRAGTAGVRTSVSGPGERCGRITAHKELRGNIFRTIMLVRKLTGGTKMESPVSAIATRRSASPSRCGTNEIPS